ncbi:MAG: CotS family spore coat protein [Clostridiales bacterium]
MEKLYSIVKKWGITPQHIEEIKFNVWRVKTSHGDYALKCSELNQNRLDFIATAHEHLNLCGFQNFAKPISCKGLPYLSHGDDFYTLYDWVCGEPCNFDNIGHLRAAAEALGKFHLYSRSEKLLENQGAKFSYFSWIEKTGKRIEDMEKFQALASLGERNFFEKMYLGFYEPFMAKAKKSKKLLLTSSYPGIAHDDFKVGAFIHYDVAARNFIIQGKEGYLIDFDYCTLDMPIVDLMRLIKRSLKYGNDSESKIKAIVSGYTNVKPLTKKQWEVLYALLLFPQKYWRLAERYFGKDTVWSLDTFNKKIRSVVKELENENRWLPILRQEAGLGEDSER